MELAHVVYRVSKDADLAARFQSDPESMLEKLGLRLSEEEQASLLSVLRGKLYQSVLDKEEDKIRHGWW